MQSKLNKRIMRRIYIVYALRLASHPLVLKSVILAFLVAYSGQYVSYSSVMANMPHSYSKLPTFIGGAIANTEYMTIGIELLVVVVFAYLMRDLLGLRSMRATHIARA